MSESDAWDPDPCPNCGKEPHQIMGATAECMNGNCAVLQYEKDHRSR